MRFVPAVTAWSYGDSLILIGVVRVDRCQKSAHSLKNFAVLVAVVSIIECLHEEPGKPSGGATNRGVACIVPARLPFVSIVCSYHLRYIALSFFSRIGPTESGEEPALAFCNVNEAPASFHM